MLTGFAGFVGHLDETIAVVVLSLVDSAKIVGSDPNAATVAPNRLWIRWHCGFRLRGLHGILLLIRNIGLGGEMIRRTKVKRGPVKIDEGRMP